MAPALQAHAKELEKHMRADSLEHKIKERPDPEQLIERGILEGNEDPRRPAEWENLSISKLEGKLRTKG